ncbi:MAG: DAK2 domain-containing protein [Clostridiales bacterium]|nr:DAK2 domain-containing protein [Clostridiales bacterium]
MSQPVPFVTLVSSATAALRERAEEVNRLNVFPVPDGDTGTNMALTMESVVAQLAQTGPSASLPELCAAMTHGSLMGARGNSGVILSQILRGLAEVVGTADGTIDPSETLAQALERATAVAFQAVRKPVEGTMLTVLRDAGVAAREAADASVGFDAALDTTLAAVVDSVRHTPELLPVLKENGVVDAGGFGLAILCEGLIASWRGTPFDLAPIQSAATPVTSIVPVDDWDDSEFLYCTEFLLYGDALDKDAVERYTTEAGGSELVVGESDMLKIHVHTNDPGQLLSRMTSLGEIAEVHINNMRRQTAERTEALRSADAPAKALGIVAVAAGKGITDILRSLGADLVVNGGQTMNPSTAEILAAVNEVNAEQVVILPNNKNIQMAAQQVIGVAKHPVSVVPTTSVPEAFAALLAVDPSASLEVNVAAMTDAAASVRTGEVTTAVKDSVAKSGRVKKGQVIGIADHEIAVVGHDVLEVAVQLSDILAEHAETLTILGGEDLGEEERQVLASRIVEAHPDLEVEHHDGGQPLYPVILSAE